jgi:hypothetical protein
VGFDEAPVLLGLHDRAASPRAARADPSQGDISDLEPLHALEQELRHDLLRPGRARLGVGGDERCRRRAKRKSFQIVESKWWLWNSRVFFGPGAGLLGGMEASWDREDDDSPATDTERKPRAER